MSGSRASFYAPKPRPTVMMASGLATAPTDRLQDKTYALLSGVCSQAQRSATGTPTTDSGDAVLSGILSDNSVFRPLYGVLGEQSPRLLLTRPRALRLVGATLTAVCSAPVLGNAISAIAATSATLGGKGDSATVFLVPNNCTAAPLVLNGGGSGKKAV